MWTDDDSIRYVDDHILVTVPAGAIRYLHDLLSATGEGTTDAEVRRCGQIRDEVDRQVRAVRAQATTATITVQE